MVEVVDDFLTTVTEDEDFETELVVVSDVEELALRKSDTGGAVGRGVSPRAVDVSFDTDAS